MLKEFREFAMKGNIIDLAIAVIIAGAFGKIVTELTATIIMPLVSMIMGKASVSDIVVTVNNTLFPIGRFFQAIIDFILIAFVLFLIIKGVNRMNRKKDAEAAVPQPPELSTSEKLLVEIRDALKK